MLKDMLMKTNKWIILLLIVFCRCANVKNNVEECTIDCDLCIKFPEVNDRYVYQSHGTMEWQVESYDDFFNICQLPEDVLGNISTLGLIDAVLHIPCFQGFFILSNNSSALKWNDFYQYFNSANALFQRDDVGDVLVDYYKNVNVKCLDIPYGRYGNFERLLNLECLFTNQAILDKMSQEKKKEAVASILSNYKQCPSNWFCIFPMVYIMYDDQYAPIMKYAQEHVNEFRYILAGEYLSEDLIDIMFSFAKSYIK